MLRGRFFPGHSVYWLSGLSVRTTVRKLSMSFRVRKPIITHWINTLAVEVLIVNSTGLRWPEGTTTQQGYSVHWIWTLSRCYIVCWFVGRLRGMGTSLDVPRGQCANALSEIIGFRCIQSATAKIRRGKKEERKRKKAHGKNITACPIT